MLAPHFDGATMADELKTYGALDRARININKDHELRYWTKELCVDQPTLKHLVKRVGNSSETVRNEVLAIQAVQKSQVRGWAYTRRSRSAARTRPAVVQAMGPAFGRPLRLRAD
jgi:hypothetical protein